MKDRAKIVAAVQAILDNADSDRPLDAEAIVGTVLSLADQTPFDVGRFR